MTLLDGIFVLDLTNVLSGPFATYQLSLMGANVLKVERPNHGDLARVLGADADLSKAMMGASFLAQNAGKHSISLNLKSEAGRTALLSLARTADVLVENFRPGVLSRLGLGWDDLREQNPKLIYCSISGFGQTGPLRDHQAYDQIIQGFSGMSAATGTQEVTPLRIGFPICDTVGGYAAAMTISAALVRRDREGIGCHLDVSLLESAVSAMGWVVSDYLIADRLHTAPGNNNPTSAPSGTFITKDGMLNIAANQQGQFERLCRAIGLEELIQDPRFRERNDRIRHRIELNQLIEQRLSQKPAAEWEALLSKSDVPAGCIQSVAEALSSPQLQERDFVVTLTAPQPPGPIQVLGGSFCVDGERPRPHCPPPSLGQDTESVLTSIGYDPIEIDQMRTNGDI